MTDKRQTADDFWQLAIRHDTEVARHADAPDAATDALGDQVEQLARNIARIPVDDLDGIRMKAAIYAYYRGLRPSDPDKLGVPEVVLLSMLDDLLRTSPHFAWLRSRPRA